MNTFRRSIYSSSARRRLLLVCKKQTCTHVCWPRYLQSSQVFVLCDRQIDRQTVLTRVLEKHFSLTAHGDVRCGIESRQEQVLIYFVSQDTRKQSVRLRVARFACQSIPVTATSIITCLPPPQGFRSKISGRLRGPNTTDRPKVCYEITILTYKQQCHEG